MSRKVFRTLLFSILVICSGLPAMAQSGANSLYTPYSVFGIGDMYTRGNAYTRSMGGVGIANRDKRYLSLNNPASVTARDTLSVLFDFSLAQENRIYSQNNFKSANNILNINDIAFSFPVVDKRVSAMIGISPFSSVGYDFQYDVDDPYLNATVGGVTYSSSGTGSIYQLFGSVGFVLWNRLSLGVQGIYYFGNIDKNTTVNFGKTGYRNLNSGYVLELNSLGAKFGAQYEQPVNDMYLTIGATYRTGSKIKGYVTDFNYAIISTLTDTLRNNIDTLSYNNVRIAGEIGVGVSLRKPEKWSLEVNYLRSDWTGSNFEKVAGFANVGNSVFSTSVQQSVHAGFEFIPNLNDIRYYMRRCAYRFGAYYKQEYYKLDGNNINSYGLTFGMTFPVFRYYNGISIGMDIGRRGSTTGNMTRETYAKFVVGFNLHDLWFIKQRYD